MQLIFGKNDLDSNLHPSRKEKKNDFSGIELGTFGFESQNATNKPPGLRYNSTMPSLSILVFWLKGGLSSEKIVFKVLVPPLLETNFSQSNQIGYVITHMPTCTHSLPTPVSCPDLGRGLRPNPVAKRQRFLNNIAHRHNPTACGGSAAGSA